MATIHRGKDLAVTCTFKLRDGLTWHGAIGESLRAVDRGGPDLRVYVGLKFEVPAPWKKAAAR